MVAAGGGGGAYYSLLSTGGYGGGLSGGYGQTIVTIGGPPAYTSAYPVAGGSQTGGGAFGAGGSGSGSGYYGGYRGGAQAANYVSSGSGGSSFISGHSGCNAITSITDRTHTGQPNHYSGMIFSNTVMTAGNASMPNPDGGTQTGHGSSGVAVITFLGP